MPKGRVIIIGLSWLLTTTVVSTEKLGANQQTSASSTAEEATVTDDSGHETLWRYLPDDVFAVASVQASRLVKSKELQAAIKPATVEELLQDIFGVQIQKTGLDLSGIRDAAIFIHHGTMRALAADFKQVRDQVLRHNKLKQLGLAMHNCHDSKRSFPDDDGFSESKGNLSWRVHLLPYMGEAVLYRQFRLSERWDSEHNKKLIGRMPEAFRIEGVKDAGKTPIHVLTGPGTPFGGNVPPKIKDISDGTSSTILTVIAGVDKAEIWTKPGGLELNIAAPLDALGNIEEAFDVGLMDGSTRRVLREVIPESFLSLAQHKDGLIVDYPVERSSKPAPMPGIIVCLEEPFDQPALLQRIAGGRQLKDHAIDGHPAVQISDGVYAIFPDPHTLLLSNETTLRSMMSVRGKAGATKSELMALYPSSNLAIVARKELTNDQLSLVLPEVPLAGVLRLLTDLTLTLDASRPHESMLQVALNAEDKRSAQHVFQMANGDFQRMKEEVHTIISRDESNSPATPATGLRSILECVTIENEGPKITLTIPKVEASEKFMGDLNSDITLLLKQLRFARGGANERRSKEAILQLGEALHQCHDTFNRFPLWNSSAKPSENHGLSWRVHLLPFLNESALYGQFHLDEPWDSEHNKTLIAKMPSVFKCDGVEGDGQTSFHVFRGERTPLGGRKPVGFGSITDGTSNTLMIVQSGPDTAEVWTKPSGLEYDSRDPKKCLGKIRSHFLALLCDGSARFVSGEIDDQTLIRLIEHADGEVIGEF